MRTAKLILTSVLIGLLLGLNSCKKDTSNSATPAGSDITAVNNNKQFSNLKVKQQPVPDCGCPKTLILGPREESNNAKSRKIHAFFLKDSVPDQVGVKGTNDIDGVNGKHNRWHSKDKYNSLQQTLVLYMKGQAVKECPYSAGGTLIPPTPPSGGGSSGSGNPPPVITPTAQLSSFGVVPAAGGTESSWTSSQEVSVDYYVLDRTVTGGVYEPITGMAATGAGSYYFYDDIVDPGTYTYRVRAVFLDGTEMDFPGATITIN